MSGLAAVVFDMDGVLIDTEPVWRRTEIEVFRTVGLELTEPDLLPTMGVPMNEVARIWFERHPWEGPTHAEIAERVVAGVAEHVRTEGAPQPGVEDAFSAVEALGLPVAIASSSSPQLIEAVLDRLGLRARVHAVASAAEVESGKPAPDVYLLAAQRLAVAPELCVAVEDAPNGVLSALAAGMKVVAVPDPAIGGDERIARAHVRLTSLTQLDADVLRRLGA